MSKRGLNILLGAASLTLGGLLYILFRENSYIASFVNGFTLVSKIRQIFRFCACDFLKYYFPDFLWGFSLCCGLMAIYVPAKRGMVICGLAAFLFGCLWELAQYLGIVSGTGDALDMIMYLTAGLAGIFINLKERVK